MTTDSRNPDLIARALAANAQFGDALAELISIANAIRATLSTAVETPVEPPLNAPQTREEALAAHRSPHSMGVPGKIESDPELEAFILARIDGKTYAQIIADVKVNFPADRQTSVSAVQRWFRKRQTGSTSG